jgi:hypothetical protein
MSDDLQPVNAELRKTLKSYGVKEYKLLPDICPCEMHFDAVDPLESVLGPGETVCQINHEGNNIRRHYFCNSEGTLWAKLGFTENELTFSEDYGQELLGSKHTIGKLTLPDLIASNHHSHVTDESVIPEEITQTGVTFWGTTIGDKFKVINDDKFEAELLLKELRRGTSTSVDPSNMSTNSIVERDEQGTVILRLKFDTSHEASDILDPSDVGQEQMALRNIIWWHNKSRPSQLSVLRRIAEVEKRNYEDPGNIADIAASLGLHGGYA